MGLSRSFFPCLFVALGACHGSSSGSGTFPTVTNLGLSAVALHGQGELWALEVSEAGEGAGDLDGDGDTGDCVIFLYDLTDGSLTNLELALGVLPIVAVGDVLVAFGVQEAEQGVSDLNGDGDMDDLVLHVHDVRTGLTTSTGLAMVAVQPAIGLGTVAFAVHEAAQGNQDLDGDGTTNGFVLHVYDSRTLLTTNAQRNITSDIVFHDHAFGFTTDEASAGMDLNGDGDQSDTSVFEMFDLQLGGIEQVPLAIRGRPLAVDADDWILLADEGEMGLDLNGDGDMDEAVIHEVHPHLHTQQSLGLSCTGSFGSTADGVDLALVVQEVDGVDRNGDGDSLDWLAVLYSSALDQAFDPGLAIEPNTRLVLVEGHMGFLANEFAQDQDLNGDGDLNDDVVHLLDRISGITIDLGLDALQIQEAGGLLLFWRQEDSAGEDWNGDGDQDDIVTFYRDPLQAVPSNTGIASAGAAAAASADSILLLAHEPSEESDLNGDGDTNDLVYVLHDVSTQTNTSLGLATTQPGAGLTADGRGVLLVSESSQNADLNGDGDSFDSVLHALVVH